MRSNPFFPDRIASRILGMGDVVGFGGGSREKSRPGTGRQGCKKISRGKGSI
ncbi:MAG: hypothetical protein CM1200mP41_04840 [Gammaproteobacteria bacterium]|nr:MAG: hypothetical protein CM1200mP41_04840 [Gammaproteobacteria bacterium]